MQAADTPTLGEELDQARQRAGFSLRDLAKETGIPHSQINRIMKNEVDRPSPQTLALLARALGISVARLFTLAGYPYPDLDDLLKTDYGLTEPAIADIHRLLNEHSPGRS